MIISGAISVSRRISSVKSKRNSIKRNVTVITSVSEQRLPALRSLVDAWSRHDNAVLALSNVDATVFAPLLTDEETSIITNMCHAASKFGDLISAWEAALESESI